jgi:hypothetical protein
MAAASMNAGTRRRGAIIAITVAAAKLDAE